MAQVPWGGQQPQSQTYPQTIAGMPANTQVIYVQSPAFKPSPNFRHISYLVLGLGILLTVLLSATGSEVGYIFGNSMCCGSIGVACVLDAIYYNGKSNWQQQMGADTSGSTVGMLADIVFAVLAFGMALLFLIGPSIL